MEPFVGQLMLVGFNFAPRGFATCEGQLLPISQNTALFSLLGTTYGGDGRTSFGLPDLRGRSPIGRGSGPGLPSYNWGERGGNYQTNLNITNLPQHNHAPALHVSSANASLSAATPGASLAAPGDLDGRTFTAIEGYNTSTPNVALGGTSITSNNVGSNLPFNNMQPFLGMYWVIALVGIFPSRN